MGDQGTAGSPARCGAGTLLGHAGAVPAEKRGGVAARGDCLQGVVPQRLAEVRPSLARTRAPPDAARERRPQETVCRDPVRVPQEACWLDGTREVRQERLPIPAAVSRPRCLAHGGRLGGMPRSQARRGARDGCVITSGGKAGSHFLTTRELLSTGEHQKGVRSSVRRSGDKVKSFRCFE